MKNRIAIILFVLILLSAFTCPVFADVVGLEQEVPTALVAYLPNAGIDFLTDTIEGIVNVIPINALLMAMNPLYSECYMGIASIEINLTQIHVGDIGITVSPTTLLGLPSSSDYVYLMFEINKQTGASNMFEVNAGGELLCSVGSYSATAEIDLTKVQVAAAVSIQTSDKGDLNLVVEDIAANLVDFNVDIHNFPDTLEGYMSDILEDVIITLAEDMGKDFIEDFIEDELGTISLEGDTAFGSDTLHYGLTPSIVSGNQGIMVPANMELYLTGTDIDPCIDPGYPIGSRYTDNPIGAFSQQTPGGEDYHLAAALSDDILNQLVYSAFIKGLLCMNPTEIADKNFTGRDFENLMDEPVKDALGDMMDLEWLFAIYPNSTPTMEVGYNGNDLSLVIEDMRFDWSTVKQGRQVELVNAVFEVEIGLDVEMDEDNNILITFNNPNVDLDIHSSSFNLLPIEQMEPYLQSLITLFLGLLDDLIPPIPMPSLAGWTLLIQELAPIGNAEDYLALYLLVETPGKSELDNYPDTQFVFASGDDEIRGASFDLGPEESALYGLNDGREMTIGVEAVDNEANKFVYRVDGAAWKMLYSNQLSIGNLYEGTHTLEVKAKNDLNRTDETPASLRFICDNVAPTIVSLERQGQKIVAEANDYLDDQLSFRFRVDNGLWSEPQTASMLIPEMSAGDHKIDVIAIDRAGNRSETSSLDIEVDGDDDDDSTADDDSDDDDAPGDSSDTQARNDNEASSGGCGF